MSESSQHARASASALANLGGGGDDDRLGFSLIVGLLWRCVRLLRPVAWQVGVLVVGYGVLGSVGVGGALVLFDLFWTRALEGQPLSPDAAAGFGLDPAVAVHVAALDAETRRTVARGAMGLALGLAGVAVPVGMALSYLQVWILQRVNQQLRIDLQERLQNLSLRFHSESRVGDALYRLVQDSAMVTQLIDVIFFTPVFATARFLFLVLLVSVFDPALALAIVAIWPPALLVGLWFSRRLRRRFRRARETNSALTSRIQETLAGIRVIKAYGAESREQERFEQGSQEAFAAARTARSLLAVFGIAIFWLVGVSLLGVTAAATLETRTGSPLYMGALLAAAGLGAWNLGLYNAFKFLTGSGTDQVRALFKTWGRTQDIAIGLDRVFELLDLEPEVRDAPDAQEVPPLRHGVAFCEVSFRYQPDRPAIEQATFEARAGEITAIVGPTGSGKSTLMALLLRLFDPDEGHIEIDGQPIERFRVASLRSRIAIALQENLLFGTTVRENIRYAAPEASDEEVRRAARVAGADEFIRSLPDGYDTQLGERGTKLSTGQRQRLSIARALLKDPEILILDEPTAALDAQTEHTVLRNLAEWGRGRAIFLITHRLSTIRRADRIVCVEAGRVVEVGSHDALMTSPTGVYRSLVAADTPARAAAAT